MLEKTEAIVLHAFKYGESRMIIDMFTRRYGRLSFVAALPKSGRGKLKKQLFQPLTLLVVDVDVRPRLQLQKLSSAALMMPLPQLQVHEAKLSMTLFLGEFLYHALKGEQQNELLFSYITSSLQWLDGAVGHVANFHLVFLMHLARFLGFYPNLEGYREGCYFDLRASAFTADMPLHRDVLMADEAAKVQLMMRMDYATMHLFRLTRLDRQRLLDIILAYYRIHLPAFPELRSLDVLQQLWG